MNRRSAYGSSIIKRLPYHIQIYSLTSAGITRRLTNLREQYVKTKAYHHKRNGFIRQQIETNQYLCYHCRTPLEPNKLLATNRHNMYHLKCAILINMISSEIVVERREQRETRTPALPDL